MKWSEAEVNLLDPILAELISGLNLEAVEDLLVLCSGDGKLAFRLAEASSCLHVTGVELEPVLVNEARTAAVERGLSSRVEFFPTEKTRLPFPDHSFDALVSEFIIYPAPSPTEMGQREMARVLFPGGKMIITDVIVLQPIPAGLREELHQIGLDYLCNACMEDFHSWMEQAGLEKVEVKDLTALIRPLWEVRAQTDPVEAHRRSYSLLLEESPVQLGKGLFYIGVRGVKPDG